MQPLRTNKICDWISEFSNAIVLVTFHTASAGGQRSKSHGFGATLSAAAHFNFFHQLTN
jgi:hypothetical protein